MARTAASAGQRTSSQEISVIASSRRSTKPKSASCSEMITMRTVHSPYPHSHAWTPARLPACPPARLPACPPVAPCNYTQYTLLQDQLLQDQLLQDQAGDPSARALSPYCMPPQAWD